jgi:diguanylate cyclase (GGDEF)-like protein/PAS domain S-box-containing protein
MNGDPNAAPHRVLRRQLRRLGLDADAAPDAEAWAEFLQHVSAVYTQADDDRYLLERSLEISGTEMEELYEELRQSSASALAAEHARLLAVTEHSPIAIVEADSSGRVVFENGFARELAGRSLLPLGDGIGETVHPDDRPALEAAALACWEDGEDRTILARYVPLDGDTHWCRLRIRAIRESDNVRWFVAAADVTDEIEARASSDRLTALLEAATDVVAVFDPRGELLHLNRIGCRYLGVGSEDELHGRTLFELFDPFSRERVRKEAFPALEAHDVWSGEATLVSTGEATPTSIVLLAHRDERGQFDYGSAIARDVTELKEVQHALAREATHDGLTGLPNRTLLQDRLAQATLRSERTGSGLAVLYIDLDRVKLVNDSLGHDAGDKLLVQAADRLRNATRSHDTIGRLGGDEFVVVVEDIDGPREGVRLAMRIVHEFNQSFDLEGTEAFVTASVGVAFRSASGGSAATLLRDADVAMYRAKEAGGARYEMFDAAMRAWVTERFELEAALRHAIERDELSAHYQPQLRPETGEVCGFEALARWDRAEHGLVLPDAFIPVAEETGLIALVGADVLAKACATAAGWNLERGDARPLDIAVNVSGRQLAQAGLLEVVERVIDETGLDPKHLTLEITESVLVQDPDLARARLMALRDLGVHLAIDDFGKGYSSLAYLQRFPLDSVKIDQVFVSRVVHDATIVASVIDLAHALGFEVVAEGVETEEQVDVLIELGCDLIQGHVAAHPLVADAAMTWLEHHEGVSSASRGRASRS